MLMSSARAKPGCCAPQTDAMQLGAAMRAALIKYGRYQGAADVGPTWLRLQQRLNHLRAEMSELRAQAELEDVLA